jgi:hypothetical protein
MLTAKYAALDLFTKKGNNIKESSFSSELSTSRRLQVLLMEDPVQADDPAFTQSCELLQSAQLPVIMIVSGQYAREDQYQVINAVISKNLRVIAKIECVYWSALSVNKIIKLLQTILSELTNHSLYDLNIIDCVLLYRKGESLFSVSVRGAVARDC